jgi:hypothetical protein
MYLDTRIHLSSAIDIPNKYLIDHPHLNQSSPNPYPPSPQQLQIAQATIADYEHRIEKIKKILKKGDLPRENDERGDSTHSSRFRSSREKKRHLILTLFLQTDLSMM